MSRGRGRRLSDKERKELVRRIQAGETDKALAVRFNMSRIGVYRYRQLLARGLDATVRQHRKEWRPPEPEPKMPEPNALPWCTMSRLMGARA